MSIGADPIACRNCGESVDVADRNCPRCGTAVRGRKAPAASIVIGVLFVMFGAGFGGWLHALVGLFLAGGGHLLSEQRRRFLASDGADALVRSCAPADGAGAFVECDPDDDVVLLGNHLAGTERDVVQD